MSPINKWENRIIRVEDVDPNTLIANSANWRKHPPTQTEAMLSILDKVGWVQSVVVNENSGNLVDGHLRVSVALGRGEATVPVLYVNLTDEEERLVLYALDQIAELATTDDQALAELTLSLSFLEDMPELRILAEDRIPELIYIIDIEDEPNDIFEDDIEYTKEDRPPSEDNSQTFTLSMTSQEAALLKRAMGIARKVDETMTDAECVAFISEVFIDNKE